jgi:hypothetical protein
MDHRIIYYLVLAVTLVLAFRFGTASERQAAATATLASLVTSLSASSDSWSYLDIELFVVDLAVLASFWTLSLKSDRFWPYWVTGWQLVSVLMHIQRGLFAEILPAPYALLSMYLSYPILLLILAASLHRKTAIGRASA